MMVRRAVTGRWYTGPDLISQPVKRFYVFLAGGLLRKLVLLVGQSSLSEGAYLLAPLVVLGELVGFRCRIDIRIVRRCATGSAMEIRPVSTVYNALLQRQR